MSIPNVHYVLGITKNLLSVSEATTNGTIIEFHSNCAIIKHKLQNGEMLRTSCPKLGRLYPLQMMEETQIEAHTTLGNIITNTTLLLALSSWTFESKVDENHSNTLGK